MNITLSTGESLIRNWDYGKTKVGRKTTEHSLVLTNKRIVAMSEGPQEISRTEIPLEAAKSIDGAATKQATFFTYVKLVFSIIFSLVIIGIPLLLRTLKELRACTFELTVTTSGGEGSALYLGGATEANKRRSIFSIFKRKKKAKVYVDKKVAFNIIDEVGAAIISAKTQMK